MDNKPKMVNKNRVTLLRDDKSIKQPNVDYEKLVTSFKKQNLNHVEDLRKESFYNKTDMSVEEDNTISAITSDSLIPIPGMLIDYENSESGDSYPMSNWVAPHGPQWGPAVR